MSLRAEPMTDVGAEHAEGAVWDPKVRRLLFVDITTGRVFDHDPTTGATLTHQVDRHVSAAYPTSQCRPARWSGCSDRTEWERPPRYASSPPSRTATWYRTNRTWRELLQEVTWQASANGVAEQQLSLAG